MGKDVPGHISTRIISQRELVVDGVPFQWWAVGERPALVTVRTPIFGSLTEFASGDIAEFAALLARRVLAQHYARAATARKREQIQADAVRALKKPGWFEAGELDFSSTGS